MKKILALSVTIATIFALGVSTVSASSTYPTGSTGVDISYPNCSAAISKVSFGVVGVTGGLVYSTSNCLKAEAGHFSNLSLYANTGLNASNQSAYYVQAQVGCNGDVYCTAYNYGYNAAMNALNYASSQGVGSTKWWLDLETDSSWDSDVLQNQKSLQGEYDAFVQHGAITVGVYSTTMQWQSVTGSWQNNWPSWGATTWTTASQAQTYCTGHQFTGGASLLMQYKSRKSKLDQDVAC